MPEHYTRNTKSVLRWCNVCAKQTKHYVFGGRVSRCIEHDAFIGSVRAESPAEATAKLAVLDKLDRIEQHAIAQMPGVTPFAFMWQVSQVIVREFSALRVCVRDERLSRILDETIKQGGM